MFNSKKIIIEKEKEKEKKYCLLNAQKMMDNYFLYDTKRKK